MEVVLCCCVWYSCDAAVLHCVTVVKLIVGDELLVRRQTHTSSQGDLWALFSPDFTKPWLVRSVFHGVGREGYLSIEVLPGRCPLYVYTQRRGRHWPSVDVVVGLACCVLLVVD